MSSVVFNLTYSSPPIAGPAFMFNRDKDGKVTGSHRFTALKGYLATPGGQSRFKKGTPITALDSSLPASLNYLVVNSVESQVIPGGYEEITTQLQGYTEEGEFEFDREASYSFQCNLIQRSILENPKYLKAVEQKQDRAAFTALYDDKAFVREIVRNPLGVPTSLQIVNSADDEDILATLTDENVLKWYVEIFEDGTRTYEATCPEWRKTTANIGGLSESQIEAHGKRDSSPPGDPPTPPVPASLGGSDWTWLKSGASDERGPNNASTDECWSWGRWPELVYEDAS